MRHAQGKEGAHRDVSGSERVLRQLKVGTPVMLRWVLEAPACLETLRRGKRKWGASHFRWLRCKVVAVEKATRTVTRMTSSRQRPSGCRRQATAAAATVAASLGVEAVRAERDAAKDDAARVRIELDAERTACAAGRKRRPGDLFLPHVPGRCRPRHVDIEKAHSPFPPFPLKCMRAPTVARWSAMVVRWSANFARRNDFPPNLS
jgi:hypothetical protein